MAADEEDDVGGVPEWVVTFGDMMSLLLTFFIMLVSMSEIKEKEKFQAMVDALQQRFGYEDSIKSPMPGQSKPVKSDYSELSNAGRAAIHNLLKGGVRTRSPVGDNPPQIILVSDDQGRRSVGAPIFFGEKSAELTGDSKRRLEEIILLVKGKPQKIIVSGHTSRRPVDPQSGYANNMDLAFQRGHNTMQYLIEKGGIRRNRFRLSVAGSNEPLPKDVNVGNYNPDARVMVYLIDEVIDQTPGIREP